jgi:hypothetical protein
MHLSVLPHGSSAPHGVCPARSRPVNINQASFTCNEWAAGFAVVHHAEIDERKLVAFSEFNNCVACQELRGRKIQAVPKPEDIIGC